MTRTWFSPKFLFGLMLLLGIVALAQVGATSLTLPKTPTYTDQLPPLSEHALQRHPVEAPYVHQWINTHNTQYCKWDCGGRDLYACQDESGQWLFAVVIDGAKTLTAYIVDQGYAVGHTRDDPACVNPYHYSYSHP